MRVTLKDISYQTSLSVSTICDILNNRPKVSYSKDVRRRVLNAAKEMEYRPNAVARSLRRNRTGLLGLVIPSRQYSYFADIAMALEKYSRQRRGHVITVFLDEDNPSDEMGYVEEFEVLLARQVDGIIVLHHPANSLAIRVYTKAIRLGVGLVLIDQELDLPAPFVGTNDVDGAREAVSYLVKKGHRRIAHLSAPEKSTSGIRRLEGYRLALQEAGLPFDPSLVCGRTYQPEDGRAAAEEILSLRRPPTAVFCANDILAGEFYDVCRKRNIRIPEDVSVVGFGGLNVGEYMYPPLTTMCQDADKLGKEVVEVMLHRIQVIKGERPSEAPAKRYIDANLIERESVRQIVHGS